MTLILILLCLICVVCAATFGGAGEGYDLLCLFVGGAFFFGVFAFASGL